VVVEDNTFSLDACRDERERDLTVALNSLAKRWLESRVALIGPVVQQYAERKLVYFLEASTGPLIRVEYHDGKAVLGFDLTGQGGPDLDPLAPGVVTLSSPGSDPELLAQAIAPCLDVLLSTRG
jgi:hypothetical protein